MGRAQQDGAEPFVPQENGTLVTRSVSLYLRRALARPFLLAIAQFFQRALEVNPADQDAANWLERLDRIMVEQRRAEMQEKLSGKSTDDTLEE